MFPSTHLSLFLKLDTDESQSNWERFFRLYGLPIQNWFRSKNLQQVDAEDLAQQVLVKLFQKLDTYDADKGSFRSWLVTLLKHTLYDAHRAIKRHPDMVAKGGENNPLLELLSDQGSLDDLSSHIESCGEAIMRRAIENVKASATPTQWQAFEQHELYKRPASEVGTALGMSTGSVYQARFRLLKKLREEYHRIAEGI